MTVTKYRRLGGSTRISANAWASWPGFPEMMWGFIDELDLQLGDQWPVRLRDALQTCRTMVCLYSPWYFKSEYCGKELAVFRSRVHDYAFERGLLVPPRLVFPVMLERVTSVPESIVDIQYDNASYPAQYRDLRLSSFRRSNAGRAHYYTFIDMLAEDILSAINANPLPPSATRHNLELVPSIFAGGASELEQTGPRVARFFIVVGTSDELRPVRQMLEGYDTMPDRPHAVGPHRTAAPPLRLRRRSRWLPTRRRARAQAARDLADELDVAARLP